MYGMNVFKTLLGIFGGMLVAVMLFAFSFFLHANRRRKAAIEGSLSGLARENGFSLMRKKGEIYEYELASGEKRLFIKTITVPSNSSLTINSRNTWVLSYGGSAYHGGYRNRKYLKTLIPFLEADFGDARKVILVYPDTNKVQRYLNESEIAIVDLGEKIYDYRVMTYAELGKRFRDLL